MKYRFAVCDDSKNDADYLKRLVNEWAASADIIAEIESFSSAEAFLFKYA